ncbi:MAG: RecB family exonuclease [Candidatus Hodarchaeota archaeon]
MIENFNIKKLRRISASRYAALKECVLRECLNASGQKALIPASPSAELGNVIHVLFEKAGRGELGDPTSRKIAEVWTRLIRSAEEKMSRSWLSAPLVPLNKSIKDFEVRKIRACKRAMEIAQCAKNAHSQLDKKSLGRQSCEIWVVTNDGTVGGYIDRAVDTKKGIKIIDYKSGAILENCISRGPLKLKESYKIQLQLYAALYWSTFGIWPVALEIVPLHGASVKIDYTPEKAEKLLCDARRLLYDVNRKIADVQEGRYDISVLASAHAKNCRYCLFRPGCNSYWNARSLNIKQNWPHDIRGELINKMRLKNGKLCLKVVSDSEEKILNIRDIIDSSTRHPSLRSLLVGNKLAVFGLKFVHRTQNYCETDRTVIYAFN